jgi:hypothetical protein
MAGREQTNIIAKAKTTQVGSELRELLKGVQSGDGLPVNDHNREHYQKPIGFSCGGGVLDRRGREGR